MLPAQSRVRLPQTVELAPGRLEIALDYISDISCFQELHPTLESPSKRSEPCYAASRRPNRISGRSPWGVEYINGIPRYCIWMDNVDPAVLTKLPLLRERVQRVREFRAESKKAATQKKAATPWLFDEVRPPKGESYIAFPAVSSGRRKYIPAGFVTSGMIPGNKIYYVDRGELYEFGILTSQFHNSWTRQVAGRLKSDYHYSNTIVYNNFIWPDATPEQRERIESCAQAILDARTAHPDATLADMYSPDNGFLFPDLMAAHTKLDAAVEAAYGVDFDSDEERIVAHLFKLYAEKTGPER